MFAGLDLIDSRRESCCALDLDEIGEPFDCGCCLAAVEPGGERVRITTGAGSVEDDVNCASRSRNGPGHDVSVRRVSIDLQRCRPRVPGVGGAWGGEYLRALNGLAICEKDCVVGRR